MYKKRSNKGRVTEDMLKQLGTLRRIAKFVVTVAAPIKPEE